MSTIVVGAGIIGICTAYSLAARGEAVTLIDSAPNPASGASLGNAGVIAPASVTPWAAPGMPRKILSYLWRSESPVRLRLRPDPALFGWLARWLRECELERYRVNRERMQRLARYSRDCLHTLRERHCIDYSQRAGYLQLFRTGRDIALAEPARQMLVAAGIAHQVLDAEAVRAREPGLSRQCPLAGGLWLPEDESGSCPEFANALLIQARNLGARLRLGTLVSALRRDGNDITGVRLADGRSLVSDRVVIAAGAQSARLLAPLGVRIPLWPVFGYSILAPIVQTARTPRSAMIDEAYKTAITPFGDFLRIAGTAEIGLRELRPRADSWRTLMRVATDWFGDAAHWQIAERWAGARPMLPDGPPLLGAAGPHGLYLNLGHGSTGWAMACGSGQITADLITGHEPAISLDGLTLDRYA